MEPAFVGTIHVQLDADLLERLDRETPRLTLEADDGTRVTVTVWRARGDLTMTQFVGLRPAHYQTLVVDWGAGDPQLVPIDVNLMPPQFN
jgi:hypothetical protein